MKRWLITFPAVTCPVASARVTAPDAETARDLLLDLFPNLRKAEGNAAYFGSTVNDKAVVEHVTMREIGVTA